MSAEDKDLPAIPASLDSQMRRVLEPMREAVQRLMGKRGADGRAAVLWDDLGAEGLAVPARRRILINRAIEDAVAGITPGTGSGPDGGYVPDLTKPPTPSGLSAVGGITSVMVEWATPVYSAGHGHKQTNIYATKQPAGDATAYTFASAARVDTAPGALTVRALTSDPNIKWRIWITWESVDGVESDPAGGVGGFVVTTGQDVANLLAVLSQKITASQFATALGQRIDLIDAASTTAGSVNARVKAETDARVAAIAQEVSDRNAAITTGVNTAKAYTESWAYSKTETDSAIATAGASIRTDFASADATTLTQAQTYTVSYTYARSAIDGALSSLSTSITSSYSAADTATLNSAKAYADSAVSTYAYSKAQTDSAIASSTSTVSARLNTGGDINQAIVQAQSTATAAGNTATHLSALYTLRVQLTQGGRTVVGGFGISGSASGTAGPTIDFGVRADKFWIGAPEGSTGVSDVQPFVVQTTDQTVNGVLVPKGVYMDAAYIKNVTAIVARLGNAWIDDAKISSLSAAKLTAGDGTVGGTLKSTNYVGGSSGWIVRPDGYLEASGAVIRGTVYASAGSIGGNLLGSDYIQSATFGAGTGWQLKSNGTGQIGGITVGGTNVRAGQTAYDTGTGFYLGADGRFSLGKSDGAKLTFDPGTNTLTVSGNITANNLDAATGSFAGELSAATGTFAGTMTADAVNAVNTINLAGNSVTVPVGLDWSGSVLGGTGTIAGTPSADFGGGQVALTCTIFTSSGNFDRVNYGEGVFPARLYLRLFRNGSLIREVDIGTKVLASESSDTFVLLDSPGVGSHSYQVGMRATYPGIAGNDHCRIYRITAAIVGTKR